MTKRLPILVTFAAMLCAGAAWAQNAVPLLLPHKYFVDGSGNPCAGCSLGSFLAGTTTPTPTYTDSSMTVQNPNPVIMDASGQANIWLDPTITYKFVLQSATGSTLWTVDNISPSGGGLVSVCGPASTIQISNSSINGLTCDPNITINTASHTLLVGGAISGAHFSLQNLATIPANWTLDVTTPSTALLSLGKVPSTDISGPDASSDCLKWDGSTPAGLTTTPCNNAITSVGIAVPAQMTVSGSPLTSSGTITLGLNATGSGADVATAAGAGVNGNCVLWASGNIGDAGAPCSVAYSPTMTSGYQRLPSGLILEWVKFHVGEGSQGAPLTATLPAAFPTACLFASASPFATGTDYGEMPVFTVQAWTATQVSFYWARNADHGGNDPSALIFAIGY